MSTSEQGKQALRFWLRLLTCSNLIEQQLRSRLRAEFNVTLPQFDVLSELERAGEPQTMSELSRLLLVSNGNITGVVDRLERDALVQRKPASHDRRVQYIELTEAGRNLFTRMAAAHAGWLTDLLGDIPQTLLSQLTEQLAQVKTRLRTESFAKE